MNFKLVKIFGTIPIDTWSFYKIRKIKDQLIVLPFIEVLSILITNVAYEHEACKANKKALYPRPQ